MVHHFYAKISTKYITPVNCISFFCYSLLKKKSRQEKIILALKKNQQSNGDKKQIHFKCDPHKSYLIVGEL